MDSQVKWLSTAPPTSPLIHPPSACVRPLSRASGAAEVGGGLSDGAPIRSFGGIVYCCSRSGAFYGGCGSVCVWR